MINIHNEIVVPNDARLFFCTDVHGNIDRLTAKLDELGFNYARDYLISCGDLTDRGTNSLNTLHFFLSQQVNNSYAVIGNHEQMLIDKDLHNLFYNGGAWVTEQSEETLDYLSRAIKQKFWRALTVRFDNKTFGVVHAEVQGDNWNQFIIDVVRPAVFSEAIWGRYDIDDPDKHIMGVDLVLMGHTPVPEIYMAQNRLYFDTGAFGQLTLLEYKKNLGLQEHKY